MATNERDSTRFTDDDEVQRLRGLVWAAAIAVAILVTAALCYWDLIPMPFF